MRHFQGYVYKENRGDKVYWMARVCVTDREGKQRNLKTSRKTKTEAKQALDKLKKRAREIAAGASIDAENMTFAELARRFAEQKFIPAQYRGEKKVKGLRSLDTYKLFLETLTAHFSKKKIKTIRHADIEAFRNKRLDTPTRLNKPRSVASVNRELQLLRTIFIWAQRQDWIEKNPFHAGDPLIRKDDETKRERVLSFDEEEKLLAACHGSRAHLRPILIAAIDSGARRRELLTLTWADVDFDSLTFTIRARNAKTNKARLAIITDRLAAELRKLWEASDGRTASLVFNITSHVKNSFASACREAEITDLHFHDLRHTFVTRLSGVGILPTVTMKLAGHETLDMHSRYLNVDAEAAAKAREALNSLHRDRAGEISVSQMVN